MMNLIDHRRALHRIPEISFDLPCTLAYISSVLEALPCTITSPAQSSLCAFFDFGKKDTIAFRADMDALPIAEQTGLSFSSCHAQNMHACGHDGHMAIALSLAQWAAQQKELPQNLLFIFQPAEETVGGAKLICESGVLAQYHVSAVFGLHLWPDLPLGTVATRPGGMMCRSSEVTLKVTGRSSHVAKAEEGLDALEAAAKWYMAAMEAEKALPTAEPRLLKFGHMQAGTVRNALAGTALVEGTLRAFDDETFMMLRDRLDALAKQVAAETGCTLSLTYSDGYPAVNNDPSLYEKIKAHLPISYLEEPVRITEDFSWYQKFVPGVFFFLGCSPAPALHSKNFNFDEKALQVGLNLLQTIAEGFATWN